uniref:RVP_2 domain-containing protein n=1 Tax=Cajanus cajan TaxID=3821 RepID=A0A151R737_CAJCA|nr:hypothetical protein KK1_040312 [Cajanus cajan]
MCFINGTPLIVLYDSGATHSFISHACVSKLKLPVSSLSFELIVETPTSGSVSTSDVCLKCPLIIDGRDFMVDLICLPLSQLDVILGMDWLSSNHLLLNCVDKYIIFGDPIEKVSKDYLTANQVNAPVVIAHRRLFCTCYVTAPHHVKFGWSQEWLRLFHSPSQMLLFGYVA